MSGLVGPAPGGGLERQLADQAGKRLRRPYAGPAVHARDRLALVQRRHIGTDVIPATAWGDAVTDGFVPEDQRTPGQRDAVALAATLVDELVAAGAGGTGPGSHHNVL